MFYFSQQGTPFCLDGRWSIKHYPHALLQASVCRSLWWLHWQSSRGRQLQSAGRAHGRAPASGGDVRAEHVGPSSLSERGRGGVRCLGERAGNGWCFEVDAFQGGGCFFSGELPPEVRKRKRKKKCRDLQSDLLIS